MGSCRWQMKTSSCLGGQILAVFWVILRIGAVFGHFSGQVKSGRFTGVSKGGFPETEAESGPDWEWILTPGDTMGNVLFPVLCCIRSSQRLQGLKGPGISTLRGTFR
jgi:hypothetical protein